jgi:hypothetical protein
MANPSVVDKLGLLASEDVLNMVTKHINVRTVVTDLKPGYYIGVYDKDVEKYTDSGLLTLSLVLVALPVGCKYPVVTKLVGDEDSKVQDGQKLTGDLAVFYGIIKVTELHIEPVLDVSDKLQELYDAAHCAGDTGVTPSIEEAELKTVNHVDPIFRKVILDKKIAMTGANMRYGVNPTCLLGFDEAIDPNSKLLFLRVSDAIVCLDGIAHTTSTSKLYTDVVYARALDFDITQGVPLT